MTKLGGVPCQPKPSCAFNVCVRWPGAPGTGEWPGLERLVFDTRPSQHTLGGGDEGRPGVLSGTCILKITPAAAL